LAATPFRRGSGPGQRGLRPDYREAQAMMFLLIKLIYGPLMLHFVLVELERVPGFWFRLNFQSDWLAKLDIWFLMFISVIFLVDSALFFLGYTTEAGWLGNRLRYAETDVFRILVCIACYEPFNLVTGRIAGASYGDFRILYQGDLEHPMTWVLRGLAMLFLLLMISTSLSLFTRASNLTNRGIVQHGPYAVVRHPGYLAKNLFWLMTILPLYVPNTQLQDFTWQAHALVCLGATLGWLAWASLYFLRAITEEQFLSKDPEYVAYCEKVRYRFIPGVY
jgi:protein-S-isoprenylcysteine O-methyltransferase Ste14